MEDPESVVQTVEIIKRPGQSLGFYIREGNGRDRWDGVFISRLAAGSVAEQNGLLKIGDEILTVNGAPVSRKRLEDVVISMSIPKRLVLAVRRNPNAVNMSGDAASLGSSLSGGVPGGEEEQLPPVVVVKCPRPSQQYGTGSLGSSIMIPCHSSKSPGSDHYQQGDFYIGDQQQQRYAYSSSPAAGVQRRGDDYWGSLGKMGTSGALMIQTQQQGFFGGDDSGDSGLSSDNSGFFRQVESSGPSASTSLSKGGSSQGKEESGSQSGSGNQVVTFRHDEDFGDDISSAVSPNPLLQTQSFQQMQQQQSASGRPTSFNNTLGTCRAPSIERCTTGYPRTATLSTGYQRRSCSARPDYSSDSDTYTFDHSVRHKLGALRSHPNAAATEFYPEQTLSGGSLDWPSHYNPRWHFSPGEYATLDRRFSYSTAAEHHLAQQQRWDALDSAALAWTQRARERQTAGRDHRYMMQMGIPAPGEKLMPACYGQEIQPGGASSSLNSLLRQFDTFSLDQARSPYLSDDLTSLYSAGGGVSSDKETYTLGRQMSLNFPYGVVGGSGSASGKSPPTSQMDVTRMMAAAAVTNPRRRMARKLGSTGDCGPADYAEVIEDETSATLRSLQMNMGPRAASATSQQQLGTVSGSSSSSSTSSHQSRTLTRNPTMPSVPSTTASNSGAPNTSANTSMEAPPKSLIKAPLHIRKEAFKPYQSILPHQSSKTESSDERGQTPPPPLDGCLVCHVFCGHGLVSNRAVLQDLYCVVELDSLGCARTTVHTGAMNFDWDDRFEMDLHTARFLSFSVYSYDPGQGARHRLVYGGSVHLANLLQKPSEQYLQQQQQHHRLALQLQPRGTLYIELFYQTVDLLYRRTPSLHLSSLFGTELATVVEREKSGRNVPMLLIRCIEEVERRGLDQVGVYRLCGSARRKQQLREELEKNPFHIDLSPSVVGDINVVTVILKDFLRELPEPVCTDSMYRLLLDALSVHITEGKVSGQIMMGFVDCCPKTNQDTLFCILDHLKKVSQRCGVNKMSPINVSIIFGPLLFHPSTSSSASSDFAEKHQLTRHAELLRFLLEVYALE